MRPGAARAKAESRSVKFILPCEAGRESTVGGGKAIEHLAFARGEDLLEGQMAFAFLGLEIACVRSWQRRP